jgi:hypothetical protein
VIVSVVIVPVLSLPITKKLTEDILEALVNVNKNGEEYVKGSDVRVTGMPEFGLAEAEMAAIEPAVTPDPPSVR